MAEPMTITIIRDPVYLGDTTIELEVDGVVQPDRIVPWGFARDTMGEGFGRESETGEGFGQWARYGEGISDYGWDGGGASTLDHRTTASFVAGDYPVRMRAIDGKGNAGDWSESKTIKHRPNPPAPTGLNVTAGLLLWNWSDP